MAKAKIKMRTPSIKKSVSARTTGRITRAAKSSVNPLYGKKGVGYLKDPEKAVKNSLYHKYTYGAQDLVKTNKQVHKVTDYDFSSNRVREDDAPERSNYIKEDVRLDLDQERPKFEFTSFTKIMCLLFSFLCLFGLIRAAGQGNVLLILIFLILAIISMRPIFKKKDL